MNLIDRIKYYFKTDWDFSELGWLVLVPDDFELNVTKKEILVTGNIINENGESYDELIDLSIKVTKEYKIVDGQPRYHMPVYKHVINDKYNYYSRYISLSNFDICSETLGYIGQMAIDLASRYKKTLPNENLIKNYLDLDLEIRDLKCSYGFFRKYDKNQNIIFQMRLVISYH